MIEGIEPLYQAIGEAVQASIEDEWVTAVVEATFYTEHVHFHSYYTTQAGSEPKDFELTAPGCTAFLDVRDLFRNAGKPLWCRARFEMDAEGKFKMDWGYDDCDENGFAHFREEAD